MTKPVKKAAAGRGNKRAAAKDQQGAPTPAAEAEAKTQTADAQEAPAKTNEEQINAALGGDISNNMGDNSKTKNTGAPNAPEASETTDTQEKIKQAESQAPNADAKGSAQGTLTTADTGKQAKGAAILEAQDPEPERLMTVDEAKARFAQNPSLSEIETDQGVIMRDGVLKPKNDISLSGRPIHATIDND